jgi:hypothetical protein
MGRRANLHMLENFERHQSYPGYKVILQKLTVIGAFIADIWRRMGVVSVDIVKKPSTQAHLVYNYIYSNARDI